MKLTLKAARVNKNLTLEEAAKLIETTPQTLSSWENGITFPRVNKLPHIEKVYGLKYNEIIFLNNNHG